MCTHTTHTQHLWSIEKVFSLHSAILNLASNGLANLPFWYTRAQSIWQNPTSIANLVASRGSLLGTYMSNKGSTYTHTHTHTHTYILYIFKVYKEMFSYKCMFAKLLQSCPTLCHPMATIPTRLLCSRDSPCKNPGVDGHILLQGIFPTQGLNP